MVSGSTLTKPSPKNRSGLFDYISPTRLGMFDVRLSRHAWLRMARLIENKHVAISGINEILSGLAVLAGIAYWLFKSGKHIGSRKGYNVDRSRGRRRRR